MSSDPRQSIAAAGTTTRVVLGYVLMLVGTLATYAVVWRYGQLLFPAGEAAHGAAARSTEARVAAHGGVLAAVLVALATITLAARLVGAFFERVLRQPPVMGEIIAGIVLGPSVLGAIWPAARAFVLPDVAGSEIGIIAKIGVVLFMFLVGLETDGKLLRRNPHTVLTISHASIFAPFALGSVLALWLYPRYSYANVSFLEFSLFIGVSLSVTAFPVLARILSDRGVQHTPLGMLAIACAAVDDATAWCLLALVSGVVTAHIGSAGWTVVFVLLDLFVTVLVVRPLMARLAAREERHSRPVSSSTLALVFGGLLLSAAVTERIGIHGLFGAFLFGAVIPHEGRLAEQVRARMEDVVVVLFLPVFFAFTGMRTQIGLLSTSADWIFTGAIIAVATVGKFGGSLFAARLAGLGWRDSSALGVLMNTRGLMELIVLNAGLDMGVLSPTLFTMLVIMALVTTFTTTPLLRLVLGRRGFVASLPFEAGAKRA